MSIIVPKFHFLQIKRELLFGDTMELNDAFLGIAPETLKPINVYLTRREPFFMIDPQMTISTEHKGIVTSEFVRIHNRSSSDSFDRHAKQRLSSYVLNNLDPNRPISLVNTDNRDFPGCATSTLPFALAAKVTFVQFDLSSKKAIRVPVCNDRQTNNRYRFENRWITESNLVSNLSSRQLKFEQLDDPQPLLMRDSQLVNPSVREVMKRISTPLTPIPLARDSIDFSASTPWTKNRPLFPTRFSEKKPCPVFRFRNKFKAFQFH